MDIGRFKKISEVDEDAWTEWLGIDKSQKSEVRQQQQTEPTIHREQKPLDFNTSDAAKPLRQRKNTHGQSNVSQPSISIQIHVPHFRLPKISMPWRKLRPWLVICGIVLALLISGKWVQTKLSRSKPTQKVPTIVSADLGYKPLVPPPRSTDTPQPSKPLYDSRRKLYYFSDTLNGVHVYVTQQGMPNALKGNDEAIKKYAKSIGTTESFTTTVGTVYIATSENSGSQRLMLANDRMLMFIQSDKKITNADWTAYIQTLE